MLVHFSCYSYKKQKKQQQQRQKKYTITVFGQKFLSLSPDSSVYISIMNNWNISQKYENKNWILLKNDSPRLFHTRKSNYLFLTSFKCQSIISN